MSDEDIANLQDHAVAGFLGPITLQRFVEMGMRERARFVVVGGSNAPTQVVVGVEEYVQACVRDALAATFTVSELLNCADIVFSKGQVYVAASSVAPEFRARFVQEGIRSILRQGFA